jgi:broad specificity phosphatase PhoE
MILVRHSQPEILPHTPPAQWPLTAEGRARCFALAKQLAGLTPSAVYSSPEPKAMETAEILAGELGLQCTEIPELAEHDRSNVAFLTQSEFEAGIQACFQNPEQRVFGLESAAEALSRFQLAVGTIIGQTPAPLLVTHGTVMSLYLAGRAGADPFQIWKTLATPCYFVCPTQSELPCSEVQYFGPNAFVSRV